MRREPAAPAAHFAITTDHRRCAILENAGGIEI